VWSAAFEFVVTLLATWLVWRVITMLKSRSQSAEPDSSRDGLAGVPSWLRPRPKSGVGAIALAEPDEDDQELACQSSDVRQISHGSMQAV
jgi:hypothetical protein